MHLVIHSVHYSRIIHPCKRFNPLTSFKNQIVKSISPKCVGTLKCCGDKCFYFICMCFQGLVDIILVIHCIGIHLCVVCRCLKVLR